MNRRNRAFIKMVLVFVVPVLVTAWAMYLWWYKEAMDCCAIGLVLNILGVLITFFYGFPRTDYDGGVAIVVEDGTVIDDEGTTAGVFRVMNETLKLWHKVCSFWGLIFLLAGFVFQLYYQLRR